MEKGIKLASKDGIENVSSKLNIIYVIAIIVGSIFGLNMGGTRIGVAIAIGIGFFLIIGWIIKGKYLEGKIYSFRKMEFWLPENLTLEDIQLATSQVLSTSNIYVFLEKENLRFQHDSITYEFIPNKQNGTFRLRWSFTITKALFSSKYVSEYEIVRSDTVLIAYTIQNIIK